MGSFGLQSESKMGKVERGVHCSIADCGNLAVRSLSRNRLAEAGMKTQREDRRVYLCETHYKQWKKASKQSRELDRIRFGLT
jgi:hypothetical protein